MLNDLFIKKIYNKLEESKNHYAYDFIVTQNESRINNHIHLKIVYKYNTDLSFKTEYLPDEDEFECTVHPGEITVKEEKSLNLYEFFDLIGDWTERITESQNELPEFRKIIKVQDSLRELEEKLKGMSGEITEPFSDAESSELRSRLDELEKELSRGLTEQSEENKSLQKELEALRKDFAILKNQTKHLDKKNWLLSFYTRAYIWGQNNPKLITRAMLEVAHKFIPEPVREYFPIESAQDFLSLPDEPVNKSTEEKTSKGER
ncbi:hypothetical protein [Rossellomorea sp. RS05]|uniref:hypothetical protein n=1 Tax=Rossellomorea sp. RS05 TaxID=3149166 RepID=UPI003221D7E5